MKILNFGSCNIDIVYSLDHIVKPGETLSVDNVEYFVGGKGLNQSVALANAGVIVYHAGCIGYDGEMLREFLTNAGVNLKYLNTVDGKTGHAVIQVDRSGENSIFLFVGANHSITEEYVDSVLSDFGEGDFLVLQNEINNIDYIIDKAYSKGMKIFFNPAPFNENAAKADLNKIHCIISNETESSGYTNSHAPEAFIDLIKNSHSDLTAIITLGKNGSIYADRRTTVRQPAFLVDTVDTTAAGDTFVGYFVAQISRGMSVECALETASAAAAIAVSRKGAAPSIPKLDEVEAFLKIRKGEENHD